MQFEKGGMSYSTEYVMYTYSIQVSIACLVSVICDKGFGLCLSFGIQ